MNYISKAPLKKMCKIFIRKQFKWTPEAHLIINDHSVIHSINRELYDAVQKEEPKGYFYSQSYWDRYDKSLLFTESYWTSASGWTNWLASPQRRTIMDKYKDYFIVDTKYNILLEKQPYEVPLL